MPEPAVLHPIVRPETPADVPAIRAVTVAAFLHAAHTSHTEQFIVDALRAAGALSVSLVADVDGVVIGHVALSPVEISDGASGWFGLGPLSVMPECQRQGIGTLLVRHALDRLRALGAAGCVLLGDPGYYQRFGFMPDADLVLPGVPAQYFQALALGPTRARGIVTYHAAFDATS